MLPLRIEQKRNIGAMNIVLLAALSCLFHPAVAHPHNLTWFERQASLDADLDLYWTVDAVSQVFYLAVHAKAASGWLGFGISEMGGMEGADIMFYESEVRGLTFPWFGHRAPRCLSLAFHRKQMRQTPLSEDTPEAS